MIAIDNHTPFPTESFILPDPNGQEMVLVVMAADFRAGDNGKLHVAEAQRPIFTADVYYGNPEFTSLRYEAEVALEKSFVDVIVNAQAWAPGGKPVRRVKVGFHINQLHKDLIVHGDRRTIAGVWTVADPFVCMPIIYERALGGVGKRLGRQVVDLRNPIGLGFAGARPQSGSLNTELPNVLSSDAPANPSGFGALGRGWKPRIDFAGTYNDAWLKDRWPLLPNDFDKRYYQAAPPDQQLGQLVGGEIVRLMNMTPGGMWAFQVPRLNVPLWLIYDDREEERTPLRVDTLLIEADTKTVRMTSRIMLPFERGSGRLIEVMLGHVKPGYLRAKRSRKKYMGSHGTNTQIPAVTL